MVLVAVFTLTILNEHDDRRMFVPNSDEMSKEWIRSDITANNCIEKDLAQKKIEERHFL